MFISAFEIKISIAIDDYYRKNEIWRNKIAKFESGRIIETELLAKNCAKVMYTPDN